MEVYLVGGAVRDSLLKIPFEERDWVVVGSSPEELSEQGYMPVGSQFPVFLHPTTKDEYALARTERKSGRGHKGFIFHTDSSVTLEEDLIRRDITINAIAQDTNSNILSTPSILAMDNESASLIIGQEIPITTGESLGSSNANPFRTTSRQEVGIKLEITPQINEGSSVILNIKQEVSGVAGVITSGIDLITNKRVIETTVLVDNQQIIVLGGLIDEDTQETISKVPVLGSIPIIGKLFQSSSSTVVQRNLMVFLKPTILIDSATSQELSSEKYNYIKARQILTGKKTELIDLTESNN